TPAYTVTTPDTATPAGTATAPRTATPAGSATPASPTARATPAGLSWDLALTTIVPQWFGNAGMTVFEPFIDGDWVGPRPPDGGYRSAAAVTLLKEALAATDATLAQASWERLETDVLGDAAVIPLAVVFTPRFHGANVLGFVTVPTLGGGDPTA